MEIRLAKTAGFCFGVNRAVELTYGLLNEGHKVATLGPLIHNPQAVDDMKRRGALVADTVEDIPTGYEVIIRSHGVPRTIYDTLEQRGIVYHDATCPLCEEDPEDCRQGRSRGRGAPGGRRCRPPGGAGHCGTYPGGGIRLQQSGGIKGLERPLGPPKAHFCGCTDHISGNKMARKFGVSQKSLYKRPNF